MTSKDKTGDQLVASIRKTKSGAAARNSGESAAAEKAAEKPAASKPAADKPAPARKPAAPKTRATRPKPAAATKSDDGDGYSSGRRVWPD